MQVGSSSMQRQGVAEVFELSRGESTFLVVPSVSGEGAKVESSGVS